MTCLPLGYLHLKTLSASLRRHETDDNICLQPCVLLSVNISLASSIKWKDTLSQALIEDTSTSSWWKGDVVWALVATITWRLAGNQQGGYLLQKMRTILLCCLQCNVAARDFFYCWPWEWSKSWHFLSSIISLHAHKVRCCRGDKDVTSLFYCLEWGEERGAMM